MGSRGRFSAALVTLCSLVLPAAGAAAEQIKIGSKKFTESVILADIAANLASSAGATVALRHQLGGSQLLWHALLAGEIDLYPEYIGTLEQEILANEHIRGEAELERALARHGIGVSRSLGFKDSYALGMMPQKARSLNITDVSDLARQAPSLNFGVSDEFLNRTDGWPALRNTYNLNVESLKSMDHDLAYKGLIAGAIDVIDVYTTDPEIGHYGLRILDDDRHFFFDNEAVFLYRLDLRQRAPAALAEILRLEGQVRESEMTKMNTEVKYNGETEAGVATRFAVATFGIAGSEPEEGFLERFLRRTAEHIELTLISLSGAVAIALPLGIVAARWPAFGQIILAGVSIVQTIPSLALLVLFIPILGIGAPPAIAALFLYSLLPIVRNTASGLAAIPLAIRNSAAVLGLRPMRRLVLVELPMASPSILAGLKTAAVINVGTATLGALVGAGGYGQPILTGIRLDNFGLILEGAVPAAALALLVQGVFELAERYFVPRGLRLKPASID